MARTTPHPSDNAVRRFGPIVVGAVLAGGMLLATAAANAQSDAPAAPASSQRATTTPDRPTLSATLRQDSVRWARANLTARPAAWGHDTDSDARPSASFAGAALVAAGAPADLLDRPAASLRTRLLALGAEEADGTSAEVVARVQRGDLVVFAGAKGDRVGVVVAVHRHDDGTRVVRYVVHTERTSAKAATRSTVRSLGTAGTRHVTFLLLPW